MESAERRNGDRRKDYKRAEKWHRDSVSGFVAERRRSVRREEDADRSKHFVWYLDEDDKKNGIRRVILDRVSLYLRRDGDTQFIDMSGELSHADHLEVRQILDTIVQVGIPEVVVNLEGLDGVDSAGLGVLVGLRLWQRQHKGQLRLVNVPDSVYRTFMNCRLQKIFCIENA
jgi:anti-sigma B factor antagonist